MLVRVEKMLDDASRSASKPRRPNAGAGDAKPVAPNASALAFPDNYAARPAALLRRQATEPHDGGPIVRLIFLALLALMIATAVGLGATWFTATRGTVGALTIGAMDRAAAHRHQRDRSLRPRRDRAQRRTADRHRRRRRLHRAPPTTATSRSTAAATWWSSGVTPAARFWTLTLYDTKGRLVRQHAAALRLHQPGDRARADGAFEIRIASRARAGNWLPTGALERYVLMLRLYDTPVGVATRTQRDAPMPAIVTVGCP